MGFGKARGGGGAPPAAPVAPARAAPAYDDSDDEDEEEEDEDEEYDDQLHDTDEEAEAAAARRHGGGAAGGASASARGRTAAEGGPADGAGGLRRKHSAWGSWGGGEGAGRRVWHAAAQRARLSHFRTRSAVAPLLALPPHAHACIHAAWLCCARRLAWRAQPARGVAVVFRSADWAFASASACAAPRCLPRAPRRGLAGLVDGVNSLAVAATPNFVLARR
jgi:hypothetical protein